MNEQVSCVLLFLSPCAGLNALGVLESYDSERTSEKGAGLARRREFLLSLTLYWACISGSDRNEKLLVWFSVHHTASGPARNSIKPMTPSPPPTLASQHLLNLLYPCPCLRLNYHIWDPRLP